MSTEAYIAGGCGTCACCDALAHGFSMRRSAIQAAADEIEALRVRIAELERTAELDAMDIPDMREQVRALREQLAAQQQQLTEQTDRTQKHYGTNPYKWPVNSRACVQQLTETVTATQRAIVEGDAHLGELLAGRAIVDRLTKAEARVRDLCDQCTAGQANESVRLLWWQERPGEIDRGPEPTASGGDGGGAL